MSRSHDAMADENARREARLALVRSRAPIGGERGSAPPPAPAPEYATEAKRPLPWRLSAGLLRVVGAVVLVAVVVGAGFLVGGFLHYANEVESYRTPDLTDVQNADAIVVLTGGPQRLGAGGELLREGKAPLLLVSGVHKRATERQVRELLGVSERQFSCCVRLDFEALDTRGNARETAEWFAALTDDSSSELGQADTHRMIVVTSNYHMRRSLMELDRAMPAVELDAYPVQGVDISQDGWWRNSTTWRLLIGEYAKLLYARARAYPAFDGVLASVIAQPARSAE